MNTPTTDNSTAAQLKKEIAALKQKKFIGLNNEQLFSYVHVYSTVYTFIAANALDDEYGDRTIFMRKMKTLLNIQIRRYKKATALIEKIKLVNAILYTLHQTLQVSESDEYWNEGTALIDEYLMLNADGTPDEEELFYVMHLIFSIWYGLIEDDDSDTPSSLAYARNKIGEWTTSLSTEGSWTAITDNAVLRRYILMSINSSRMLDATYDQSLTAVQAHYSPRAFSSTDATRALDKTAIDKYTLLYYALLRSPLSFPTSLDKLTKVSNILTPQIPHLTNDATRRTLCHNIHIDNLCLQENDRIQKQLEE